MTITQIQYALARFFNLKGLPCRACPKRKRLVELINQYEPGFSAPFVKERGRKNKKAQLRYNYLIAFYSAHKTEIDSIDGQVRPKKDKVNGIDYRNWHEQSKAFYASDEWRKLRYRVLAKRGARCECCGRMPKEHGIIVHVDHIKPRYRFPDLSLVESNLQILCEDCNLGKGASDQTDWR